MKITIDAVSIKSFRNLVGVEFDLQGNSVAFSGINALGKTNVLNAIMWCLTGYDIENKSSDIDNVPDVIKRMEMDDPNACDVTVVLNVGTIRRVMKYIGGVCKKTLFINDIEAQTLKDGEIQIDQMLGILELTIGCDKDFNVRRFLLNPMYTTFCKESAFRSFVTSHIKIDTEHIYNLLPSNYRILLDDRALVTNYSITKMSYDKDIRKVKKDCDSWNIIKDFLKKNIGNGVEQKLLDNVNSCLTEDSKRLADLQTHQAALDYFALTVSNAYDNACKPLFSNVTIKLLEKGQGEDVWKEICQPMVRGRDYSINLGSTSERIMTGCYMVSNFWSLLNIPTLPLIFDECETLDRCSLALLGDKVNSQLLTAKVNDAYDFITMEVIK